VKNSPRLSGWFDSPFAGMAHEFKISTVHYGRTPPHSRQSVRDSREENIRHSGAASSLERGQENDQTYLFVRLFVDTDARIAFLERRRRSTE
jgi:hypothetical protein